MGQIAQARFETLEFERKTCPMQAIRTDSLSPISADLRTDTPAQELQANTQDRKELRRTMSSQIDEDSSSCELGASVWDATLVLWLPHLQTCSAVTSFLVIVNIAVQALFACMVLPTFCCPVRCALQGIKGN